MQEWRNWQTRRLQVPVVAILCGFKSRFLHPFQKPELRLRFGLFLGMIYEEYRNLGSAN